MSGYIVGVPPSVVTDPQVVMGLLQVGFLVRSLSDPLVGGFTTAAAFDLLVSQLKIVLSVPTHNRSGLFSEVYVSVQAALELGVYQARNKGLKLYTLTTRIS